MNAASLKEKMKTSIKPKVSVVCISYNQEKYIKETIQGFLAQITDFHLEIIISDDASSDKTPKIIQEYADKYPELFTITLRSKNVGAATNIVEAMKRARGQYIALCEGDDYWTDPQKLQKQVDYLDNHKSHNIVFHPVRVFFEDKEEDDSIFPEKRNNNFTLAELLVENYIQTNSVMYRKREYNDITLNVMPFDWYLHLIHAQNGKIGFIGDVMSSYRRHNQGLWWDMYKNPLRAWKKYGSSYLLLAHELMKMYGDNTKYEKVILGHIARVYSAYNTGSRNDSDYTKLAVDSFSLVPNEAWAYISRLINENERVAINNDRLEDQRKQLISQLESSKRQLEHAAKALNDIEDEMSLIKSSKMWRYTSKIRNIKNRLTQH